MSTRPRKVQYLGDAKLDGVSYQSWPDTDKPFKVRGTFESPKSIRGFSICLTREEAAQVVRELQSFTDLGLEDGP